MRRRGRPPVNDILTPREWEVLELLRAGLLNREIAERMGISLSGVKHHVSEIIGKLDVSSREEAAAWQPEGASRRWAFASLVDLSSWVSGVSGLLTPKMAAIALGVVVAVGTASAMVGEEERGVVGSEALMAVLPTPTPFHDPCEDMTHVEGSRCVSFPGAQEEFASLAEAAQETSFEPLLPAYVPFGFERKSLTYLWAGEIPDHVQTALELKGPRSPMEILYAEYVTVAGETLRVTQGYGVSRVPFEDAPTQMRGLVTFGDREVSWIRGIGRSESKWEDNGSITVHWKEPSSSDDGRKTLVWEIDPAGTRREFDAGHIPGHSFEFTLSSSSLPLDELLKVAGSILVTP